MVSRGTSSSAPVTHGVVGLARSLNQLTFLLARTRRHDAMKASSKVPIDRAAIVVLLELAELGPMRPGVLAQVLQVEAPHITRQVRTLVRVGYASKGPDPDDRRAQIVSLTSEGHDAADRVRVSSQHALQDALRSWSPDEIGTLAALLRRMVDDFLFDTAMGGDAESGSAAAR